ncbi:MAG TPA: BlaI/MecI/CopY family transcriptional regulator [Rhizomicrobium sp.]|nr:BlaI/MecI/CopY family transcriptional regulator [Rhizomicrobium sp.]
MALPRLSNLEMQILELLWAHGPLSVREIMERLPAKRLPAYTTVQTMAARLEAKKALRRARKVATAHIYEAAIPREAARRRLIDDFLSVFGGEHRPIMMHLVKAGRLTLQDIEEAEAHIRELQKKSGKP